MNVIINNPLYFTILIFIFILFTFFIYRRTNPIISNLLRNILIVLRVTVLIITAIILFESIVTFKTNFNQKPVMAVAIDNTASMNITDDAGVRPQIVQNILQNDIFSRNDIIYNFYTFSTATLPASKTDTLLYMGDATDISSSLMQIKNNHIEDNLAGIILISDGNNNTGQNPEQTAAMLGLPVYTIGVGSSIELPDIRVGNIFTNPYGYVDEETPVRANISQTGMMDKNVTAILQEGNKTIEKIALNFFDNVSDTTLEFFYKPESIGQKNLSVSIQHPYPEKKRENNKNQVYIDILKAKTNIVVFAGTVSPDVSFLKNALDQEARFQTSFITEKPNQQFYQTDIDEKISKMDIAVLLNYPTSQSNQTTMDNLYSHIERTKTPVFAILGPTVDPTALENFGKFLPARSIQKIAQTQTHSYSLQPHTLLNGFSDSHLLPPLDFSFEPILWPNAETVISGYSTQNKYVQLLSLRKNAGHSSALFSAFHLWKWKLMTATKMDEPFFEPMITNTVKWLENQTPKEKLTANLKKQNNLGDVINVSARLLNVNYEPEKDATLTATFSQNNQTLEKIQLLADGSENFYIGQFTPLNPGEYSVAVSAIAKNGEQTLKSISFSVGNYLTETTITKQQTVTLQKISESSKGKYVNFGQLDDLQITTNPVIKTQIRKIDLWNNKILLLIICLLLAIEWFIRKKRGMV